MQTSETIHPDKVLQDQADQKVQRTVGTVKQADKIKPHTYLLKGEHADVMLQFHQHAVIRVQLVFGKEPQWFTTPAIVKEASEMRGTETELSESDTQFLIRCGSLTAVIEKAEYALSVFKEKDGESEIVYGPAQFRWEHEKTPTLYHPKNEMSHFYGLGEKTGFLDKKEEKYTMWNMDVYDPHVPSIENLYVSIPFLVHFEYNRPVCGTFLDNPGKSVFDMRSYKEHYAIEIESGVLDTYLICADSLKDMITQYTALTGRMPMPPKWSIGYHQSRYSYMNQEEVLEIARTFKAKNIPLDVIHLDIHYMDEYRVFTWDKTRFPDPKKMMEELEEMGVKIVTIVDPGVKKDPNYPVYQEGIEQDLFCRNLEGDLFLGDVWPGTSAFPDFTSPRVREWWGNKHAGLLADGVSGIWNDMNEPSVFHNDSKTMDMDVVHEYDGNRRTHKEIHNLYGYYMSKGTFDGMKEQMEGKRPFVLTRSAYAGVQRFAAVWTGDNRSFWEHLQLSIPMVLNLGMSGVAFTGPDIGGFAHATNAELLTRWTQVGALFPFCRNHSAIDTPYQEPWRFGEEVEAICKTYIDLRYQLLPYMYTLFQEASQTGLPVMRPLLLEFEQDEQVFNLCDQFMLGSSLMTAPILRPSTEHRTVYLPAGEWIDFWTGERFSGGQHIMVHAPLSKLPLFVKAGSIIPMKVDGKLQLQVYGLNGEGRYQGRLYEDDGQTYAYEQGKCQEVNVTAQESGSTLQLAFEQVQSGYQQPDALLQVVVRFTDSKPLSVAGLSELAAEDVPLNREGWFFDEQNHDLVIQMKQLPDSLQVHK
ncbi:glycoside hydrolase family 31 protein [Marinicrinis sediminis]|uniref:TIM-barrel domain-containing protein n=1 Tax=Marinicrinis sediminis TaxID=1652465 RepID=A0ABW5RCZ4_9BACL